MIFHAEELHGEAKRSLSSNLGVLSEMIVRAKTFVRF